MTTNPEDPNDWYAQHIDEMLRMRAAAHGVTKPVVMVLCDIFIHLMRMMAAIAERNRNARLAETVAAVCDAAPCEMPSCELSSCELPSSELPGVERAAAPLRPRPARARKCRQRSAPAPARPRHVDDRGRLLWRGPGIVWPAEFGFLGADSTKWALGGRDLCVYFVTI